jgi:DNA repair protein RecN (Recombination protein N)
MLQYLSIKDFILIEQLELHFKNNLTIVTGETGAGKSILLDAISLIMGERCPSDVIRSGADIAYICAEFTCTPQALIWLNENGFSIEDNSILIKRSIDKQGKNRAFINGLGATSQQLKALCAELIQIQSQHAQQNLLNVHAQRKILDAFCEHNTLLEQVSQAYYTWKNCFDALQQAKLQFEKDAEQIEYLSWVRQDIEKLSPQCDEWEAIQQEHQRLQNASDIIQNIQTMQACIQEDGGISQHLRLLQQKNNDTKKFDADLKQADDFIESLHIQATELESYLEKYLQKIDIDPHRLTYLDERMHTWLTLARRLKIHPSDMYAEHINMQQHVNAIDAETLLKIEKELQLAYKNYIKHATELSQSRHTNAKQLQQEVTLSIQDLAMKEAEFIIDVDSIDYTSCNENSLQDMHAYGIDKINFMLRTHAQANIKPLAKVASGGELSRITLAVILATQKNQLKNQFVATLIFDEIDSGISGVTAQKIGALLANMAQKQQILCVTHLAQVAAYANQHISVYKQTNNNITRAHIAELSYDARLQELARLIGGDLVTTETLKHAEHMVQHSKI